MAKKADTSAKQPSEPKTIKVSTVVWTVSVLVALGLGFYLGVSAKTAYADSVRTEAKTLVEELKHEQ